MLLPPESEDNKNSRPQQRKVETGLKNGMNIAKKASRWLFIMDGRISGEERELMS